MKKILFMLSIATLTLLMFSCSKDDNNNNNNNTDACANITCQHNGTCVDGTCQCPSGYTGTFCETPVTNQPCGSLVCQNGTCVNNACQCNTGWEGAECDTRIKEKFLGSYSGNFCGGATTIEVKDTLTVDSLLFVEPLQNFRGVLTGSTTFNIPRQVVLNNPGTTGGTHPEIEGSGSLSGDTLTINATLILSGVPVDCSNSVFVK